VIAKFLGELDCNMVVEFGDNNGDGDAYLIG